MKPITRKEYYLAKAAGTYTGPTPPPVLREDYYLATLAGDYSGNCPAPVTRLERYMSAAAGLTSYVPQPVTRIEKYWYAIAKGTGYVPEPVTREEKFLYAILKNPPKPEYLDKTAEGSLILLPDSAEAPFTAFTIYGHSTQDGTPSPENPVPIVSAGDSGEINVAVSGKNLLNIGTVTFEKSKNIPVNILAGTYTFSAEVKSADTDSNHCLVMLRKNQQNIGTLSVNRVGRSSATITLNENADEILLYASVGFNESDGDTATFTDIQLEIGTVATAYEPYKTPQTLTLSTPGGLPGIPVDSGGNYTDESGQQWICDEIDLKRGKHVQRVGSVLADGTVNKFTASADNVFWNLKPDHTAPGAISGQSYLSIYFSKDFFDANEQGEFIYVMSEKGQEYFDTIEDLNAFCVEKNAEGNPLIIYYPMDPIETDLPAEEIAAYQALHTYSPTTTASNDAGAWMKVGYKATP